MSDSREEENLAKYSDFNLKQLKYDYHDFGFNFLYFAIPLAGTFCIFHFVDSDSRWIGFGFILAVWTLYGFYLITRPLILRIAIPIILIFLVVVSKFFQFLLIGIAEYIEKKLE